MSKRLRESDDGLIHLAGVVGIGVDEAGDEGERCG